MSTSAHLPGQLRLILAIALVHAVAWFAYYSQIPAGEYPTETVRATLDAALNLAQDVATEDSGHSLYTLLLSLLARFTGDADGLTAAARAINACALLVATGLGASAAGHYWRRNRAVWLAGLLIGLNPVLVFWAGEATPCLLATACLSTAFWCLFRWLRRTQGRDSAAIGLALTFATLFETSLVPFALLWPALAYLYPTRERWLHLLLGAAPIVTGDLLCFVSGLQLQSPLQLNFAALANGIYPALASAEGFDIKSFALYRQLHFILFLNPIHWGLLFIMATGGAYARLKDGHRGHSILLVLIVLVLFACCSALNGGGSQVRASLVPVMAILAAGILLLPKIWRHAGKRTRRKIVLGGTFTALFVYAGSFFGTPQFQNWESDYVYLAEANIRLGNNDRARTWAEKALELNPSRNDMQEVLVLAQFNDWVSGNRQRTLPTEATEAHLAASREVKGTPTTRSIQAVYLYKLREVEAAQTIWEVEREQSALALLCLYWTGAIPELSRAEMRTLEGRPFYTLLEEAKQINRNALAYNETEKLLDNMLAFTY